MSEIPSDAPQDIWQLARDWPLAFKFDLKEGDTVIIAGAYKGLAMELLSRIYPGIKVFGFEPQDWAMNEAYNRLKGLPKQGWWSIEPYGLGVRDETLPMGEWHTDAASFVKTGEGTREQGEGQIKEFSKVMDYQHIDHIDMFVCNMEGMEWDLLPHLMNIGWIQKINKLAVQFHLNMDNENMDVLSDMDKTHERVYNQFPSWVMWERYDN